MLDHIEKYHWTMPPSAVTHARNWLACEISNLNEILAHDECNEEGSDLCDELKKERDLYAHWMEMLPHYFIGGRVFVHILEDRAFEGTITGYSVSCVSHTLLYTVNDKALGRMCKVSKNGIRLVTERKEP